LAQSLNEERARLNASYAEKRQALQDSLKAERDAINARLEQAKAQYAEQERLEDEQASRQAQRDALRESRADADFNAQLARISGLQQAEQTRYDALNTDLMQLDSTIANLQGTISSLSDGVPNSVSAPMSKGNKGGFGSFSLVGLGSSTNRFLNSFGSASGGASGGFTYAPQINATVGDVASKSMVEQAFQSDAELDAQNWASTFGGLLTP
jgi:multidrug efflux pump subunit AcrA (membrane-fusion protein)